MTDETTAPADIEEPTVETEGFVAAVGDAPPLTASDLGIDLPDGPQDAVEMLLSELARARNDAEERTADLQRVAADFDNYRKRVARDQEQQKMATVESVVLELLPVLDSYDAGLGQEIQTETERRLLNGMQGTFSQLSDALARLGLEPIPAEGEPFDPAVHEAVMAPAGADQLVVSQELRRGYRLRGRVLRASMVALEEAAEASEETE